MFANPRTSLAGLIGAIGLGLQAIEGLPATLRAVLFVVAALAVCAMGLTARDSAPALAPMKDDADPPPAVTTGEP